MIKYLKRIIISAFISMLMVSLVGCIGILDLFDTSDEPFFIGEDTYRYHNPEELEDIFYEYNYEIKEVADIILKNEKFGEVIDAEGDEELMYMPQKSFFTADEWEKITELFKNIGLYSITCRADDTLEFNFLYENNNWRNGRTNNLAYVPYSPYDDDFPLYVFSLSDTARLLEDNWWLEEESEKENLSSIYAIYENGELHNPPDYENE